MVCGRSATALAIRLRWVCIMRCILGAAVPTLLICVVHWASGGLGQFALAYEWPLWLEVGMRGMVARHKRTAALVHFDAVRDRVGGPDSEAGLPLLGFKGHRQLLALPGRPPGNASTGPLAGGPALALGRICFSANCESAGPWAALR